MRRLEGIASWLHTRAVLLLTRCVAVEVPLQHIQDHGGGALGYAPAPGTPLDAARAEFMWAQQESASGHTDSMVKQMLTLSSGLATVVFTLLGGANPWLRGSAVLGLLAAVLLCLQALGVRRDALPKVPGVIDPAANQQWAEDVVEATRINRGAHAHRVDLYRAAWRWFLLALTIAALAGLTRSASPVTAPAAAHVPRGGQVDSPLALDNARDSFSRGPGASGFRLADFADLLGRALPSVVGALVGGFLAIFGGMRAQEHRALIEDQRAYRQFRAVLIDEVFALGLHCGMWATATREQKYVKLLHIQFVQVRMELYDRNIEKLALLPVELRRSLTAWYQDLKNALWMADQAADGQGAEAIFDLLTRLDSVAKESDALVEGLKNAPDDLPSEAERSPFREDRKRP